MLVLVEVRGMMRDEAKFVKQYLSEARGDILIGRENATKKRISLLFD